MSNRARIDAVQKAASRSIRTFSRPQDAQGRPLRVSSLFGSRTFNSERMRDRVPPEVFAKWVETVEHGRKLDRPVAAAEIAVAVPAAHQFLVLELIAAGMTVPNVAKILCFLTGPGRTRTIGGQLQITDDDGVVLLTEAETLAGFPPWYVSGDDYEASQP